MPPSLVSSRLCASTATWCRYVYIPPVSVSLVARSRPVRFHARGGGRPFLAKLELGSRRGGPGTVRRRGVRRDGAQRERRGDGPSHVSVSIVRVHRVRVVVGRRVRERAVAASVAARHRAAEVLVGVSGHDHRARVRVQRRLSSPAAAAHRASPRLPRGSTGVVSARHAVERAGFVVEEQARAAAELPKHGEHHRALRRLNFLPVPRVCHRLLVAGDEADVPEDGVGNVLDPVPPHPEPAVREGEPVRRNRTASRPGESAGGRAAEVVAAVDVRTQVRVARRGGVEGLDRPDHLRHAAEVPAAVHGEEQDDPRGWAIRVVEINRVDLRRGRREAVAGGNVEGTRGRLRVVIVVARPRDVARIRCEVIRRRLARIFACCPGPRVDDEGAVEIVHAARFVQRLGQIPEGLRLGLGLLLLLVDAAVGGVQPGVTSLRAGPPAVPHAPVHVILAVGLHDEEPDAVARRLAEVREVGAVEGGNRGNLEAVANLPGLSRGGAPERVAKVRVSRGGRCPRAA
mmetsp:Transcript_1024/g.2724  ORF Transcript_1024/g.2724 Transcript_1024/m.2724 type:complete len:515 (-) Transcript_1024:1418-2962(-)